MRKGEEARVCVCQEEEKTAEQFKESEDLPFYISDV